MMNLLENGLYAAAGMFWEIFWALALGFALSGIVIAFIPKERIARLLGKPGPKELGLSLFFGAASSSCSYAAAAMSRSIFQKGAHIVPSLAFLLASTNLVIELSAVLWILMGWQFVLAEFLGGFILVAIMAILMLAFGPLEEFEKKRKELAGNIEAHSMTSEGWQGVARAFVMEWRMIWKDIALGVLVAGFLMASVPDSFWQSLFLQGHPGFLQIVENAFVGPLVSVISFVCSVGNIPLAAVLYHGGITFGGAISFIYADLIILPLILVYRKYYGWKLALWITGIFYISMALTGIIVDLIFSGLGWTPLRHAMGEMAQMHFFEINYTFWLNLVFAVLSGVLVWLARSGAEDEGHSCCH